MHKPTPACRTSLLAALALALTLAIPGVVPSAPAAASAPAPVAQPLTRLVIGHSNVAPTYGPLWVAEETGLFRRHGLDVEVRTVGPGAVSVGALRRDGVQGLEPGG